MALVSSLEAVGRRRRHAGAPAGTQCPVLQPGVKIIKSSSQFIISFFPPNLILLYHSLAS